MMKLRMLFAAICLSVSASTAFAQTSSFIYQGRLTDGGTAANGNYDLQFALFDSSSGGAQVGSTQTLNTVVVSGGVFTVSLDFGASAFNGANRFLEISGRPTGGGSFILLSPRQQITSTPYAVRSLNASSADSVPASGVPSGSGNYIQNSASPQGSSNFNISGNGTAGGTLSADSVNAATEYRIGDKSVLRVPSDGLNSFNTFVGIDAGKTTGSTAIQNSFFGQGAGGRNITGSQNSVFGSFAGAALGNENSLFGSEAGLNVTGSDNTFLGAISGQTNQGGSKNVAIGYFADVGLTNATNATAIGACATVFQSNSLVLGSFSGNGSSCGITPGTPGTNVGIGTVAPLARLHVARGSGCLGPFCNPFDLEGTILVSGNQAALSFMDRSAGSFVTSPTNGQLWTWYGSGGRARLWSGTDKMSIDPNGNLRAAGSVISSTTPDIAETISAESPVTAADVVCADRLNRERVIRCTRNDRAILGIISDGSGGFLINSYGKSPDAPLTGKPLVLAGRVPVKVSLENGPIQIGDFLTTSSTAGVAMRGTGTGPTIGIALEAFNNGSVHATGTVLCFVRIDVGNMGKLLSRIDDKTAELMKSVEVLREANARLEKRLSLLEKRTRHRPAGFRRG